MENTDIFHLIETDALDAARDALREQPALLDSRDRLGRTPLHKAVAHGNPKMVQCMLDAGAAVNTTDRSREAALFKAVAGDIEIFSLLLDAGADFNQRNILGDTVLFSACDYGALEHARLLLARGAQVNTDNDFSQTPLHAAAAGRHVQIIGLLLAAGAQVDRRDWLGNSALHLSVSGRLSADDVPACLQTIDLLLAAGADGRAATKGGLTVLRFAQMHADLPQLAAALAARGLHD